MAYSSWPVGPASHRASESSFTSLDGLDDNLPVVDITHLDGSEPILDSNLDPAIAVDYVERDHPGGFWFGHTGWVLSNPLLLQLHVQAQAADLVREYVETGGRTGLQRVLAPAQRFAILDPGDPSKPIGRKRSRA